MDKLAELRKLMKKGGIDAYIVPSFDEFQGEYLPDCSKRLTWLTDFTGSAGTAVVMEKKAAFFTDGRYTLQAKKQVSGKFEQHNTADITPAKWIKKSLKTGGKIGFDPLVHTKSDIQSYIDAFGGADGLAVLPDNLIDKLWKNRPKPPQNKALIYDIKYAGQSSESKRKNIGRLIADTGADAAIITSPDSICWLLNIRGNDVAHTPYVLSVAIVHSDGVVDLFVDGKKLGSEVAKYLVKNNVKIHPLVNHRVDQGKGSLKDQLLGKFSGKKFLLDPARTAYWFFDFMGMTKIKYIEGKDPCQLAKSCKNKVEISGTKRAHVHDGAALTKFLCWLDESVNGGKNITEIAASDRLADLRATGDLFQDLSFDTISGFGANGAIVHYRSTPQSNARIRKNGLYLLDSGAQYLDGTTDVTRTIAIGKPTPEQKRNFTLVLKGHIGIATAVFPVGTRGCDIDVLARMHLWADGLDYDHGTGHGVGSYLSVHEGPQGINKRNNIELQPGMILSNEPGYYKTGEYGIRIENLVTVVEKKVRGKGGRGGKSGKKFLGFETLTMVPIDIALVDKSLLTAAEIKWLNDYHATVRKTLSPLLDAKTKGWVSRITKSV